MAEIEVGDVVLVRGSTGRFHAVVTSIRLSRLTLERCDKRPSAPIAVRDVLKVYKAAGAPDGQPTTPRLRPTAQLRLDLPSAED